MDTTRTAWTTHSTPGDTPNDAAHVARLVPWRVKGFGILRIVFGAVWAIDATFKWLPGFHANFEDYLAEGAEGQPRVVRAWIELWVRTIGVNPHFFAYVIAIGETTIALALLLGLLSNLAYLGGTLLSLGIWSTAEGFGGPYRSGSIDIGAAIIYVLVFVALFLTKAGLHFGVDRRLTPALGRGAWLASGPLPHDSAAGVDTTRERGRRPAVD